MEVVSCFTYLLILKVFCYEKCKEFLEDSRKSLLFGIVVYLLYWM